MSTLTIALDARLVGGTNTGDSTYWTGLLEGFRALADDFQILCFSTGNVPAGWNPDPRIRWMTVPARSGRWWSAVSFPLAARREGAQAIHTQYTLSPLVGKRGITTVHDVSFFIGPEWFSSKDRFILQRSIPASCRRAAQVLAVSETDATEIVRYIPEAKGKVTVTPNACPSWILPVPHAHASHQVAGRFGVTGPFLLTVGTRWARKNMELAVAAAADTPYPLVVTGKGEWKPGELGPRGHAVGYVSHTELSNLYSAASLYLAPSRHEGFGLPLLEAFRCGCPVLCSPGGALPEVAGNAAHVTDGWEPSEWTRAILSLVPDSGKLNSMRVAGFQREKSFDWVSTARRTLAVYREVGK